ncbi:MAG TPA: transglycosylase SLT domain-containing protein [Spirochaetota bacterium]|nr:transglycosylase SLT domain-containing protein [Spirochaetota bacterium]
MRLAKFIITAAIFLAIIGHSQNVFSWGLFNLFSGGPFTPEGLESVMNFDPDKDILYLPRIGNKNIFESMDDLSICRNPEVRKYIYIYLTRGREYCIRSIERSHIYGGIINEIFAKNGDIPDEIALLPLLESGFNPNAVSRSKAVGLWQFVGNTSRPLGLRTDKWIDERRDIEKSTEAAIRHLRNLHRIFNSWELALTAYNGGAGHVARAIKKSGTRDLQELIARGALSKESSEYLHRYIALVLIYKNQRLFDIYDEITVPEIPRTENYTVKYPVNINRVSELAGTPKKVIETYNPELNRSAIPPYAKDYSLRLPAEAKDRLKSREEDLYRERVTNVRTHRIRSGECLSAIARLYNVNTVRIIRFNAIRDPDSLKAGDILYIPF